jgi:hypothetical protein
MTRRTPGRVVLTAGAAAGITAAYLSGVRPRLVRAGATESEVQGPYPGAGLIPDSSRKRFTDIALSEP